MINRRVFLQRSLAAAAITALPSAVSAQPFSIGSGRKVIVLGAGLAGLSAAHKLVQQGFECVVLEARNRVGGRVFSHEIQPGLVVELGAEWVGASHQRLIDHCKAFGLELFDNRFSTGLLYKGEYQPAGTWDYSEEWKPRYQQLLKSFGNLDLRASKALDETDWWRYLRDAGIPDRDLDIRELADSTDFGESIRHVSALSALAEYASSSPYNEMDFKIRGGNSRLPEAMAKAVGPERIFLNHKVLSVTQEAKGVKVTCENGTTFEAAALICTLPTFALSKISWNPLLPAEKQAAIRSLQYARISKHALLYDRRFWRTDDFDLVTDVYGHYFYHATKSQPGEAGALISYTVGDKADVISRQNKAFRSRMAGDSLRPAFGETESYLTKDVSYYWGNDPYTQGAYAIYGKGQYFSLLPILKERFKRVFFAGEHLAEWQGFMEGAIQTGEDAAASLMG